MLVPYGRFSGSRSVRKIGRRSLRPATSVEIIVLRYGLLLGSVSVRLDRCVRLDERAAVVPNRLPSRRESCSSRAVGRKAVALHRRPTPSVGSEGQGLGKEGVG